MGLPIETDIDRRYNPENDMRPGFPPVTWAEYDLQQQVHRLSYELEELRQLIEAMRTRLAAAEVA